jgi:hypothetical protein
MSFTADAHPQNSDVGSRSTAPKADVDVKLDELYIQSLRTNYNPNRVPAYLDYALINGMIVVLLVLWPIIVHKGQVTIPQGIIMAFSATFYVVVLFMLIYDLISPRSNPSVWRPIRVAGMISYLLAFAGCVAMASTVATTEAITCFCTLAVVALARSCSVYFV